jgi:hypothetical protein
MYIISTLIYFILDDNECLIPNICGNGTCSNINGGFECSCNDGYTPGSLQVSSQVVNELKNNK